MAWTPRRSAGESQLKRRTACLHTKDNATRKARKAAKSSASPDLLSFRSNSADAFRGTLRSPESLQRPAEWMQQSLVVRVTSPSQEEQQHRPARRRPPGQGDQSPKLTSSAEENQHLNWETSGDPEPPHVTVRCGRSKAAATPPATLPGKRRNRRKSAARHLALTGGCIHTHTLPLSLLFLLASQCSSKDGVKGANALRNEWQGGISSEGHTAPSDTAAAPQQVPAQRPHLPGS